MTANSAKPTVGTAWLDGCSGCHMSLLDIDEAIIDLAGKVTFVCSPIADIKEMPPGTTVGIVEGAVSSEEDLHKIRQIRQRCQVLIALGDCAVTSNVPGMRNAVPVRELLQRAYHENAQHGQQDPKVNIPALLPKARPLHEVVKVDVFVPGCPPPAQAIAYTIGELLAGRVPNPISLTRFGK
jgi:NAD-reducing hydrogenase small subunit